MHSQKAITPILAIIMLMVIVIGLAGGLYIWISTTFQRTTNQTQRQLEHKLGQIQTTFHIEGVHGNEIYIRNDGSQSLDTTKLGVYVDGKRISCMGMGGIEPGDVGELNCSKMIVGNKLKVTSALKKDEITPPAVAKWISNDENEIFQNNDRCSPDLYVIENKALKFFVSYSPVKDGPDVGTSCVSGDHPDYVGVPMRIWDKNSQSSGYRRDHTIIDNTHLYIPSQTTANSMDNFKVIQKGLQVSFEQQGDIKPKARYTTGRNKNYVKIDLIAENVGSSDESVRLGWWGDQDPPGGSWRNDEGETSYPFSSDYWVAFIPSSTNDVYGVIAPTSDTSVEIYSNWHGIRVREKSSTTISPGETHKMTFYIMSGLKGPPGYEWEPVKYTYFKITEDRSMYKVHVGSDYTAAQAEDYCEYLGMHLFIPRSEEHLQEAYDYATSGDDPNERYLRILGIYPKAQGNTCVRTAFTSETCTSWHASDDQGFWVGTRTDITEPNGDNCVTGSMYYSWNSDGTINWYNDINCPGYTSERFMCSSD